MTNGQIPWDAPAEGQPADQFQPTQPAQTQPFTAATQPDQSQPTVPPLPTPGVPAQQDWAQPAYAQQPPQPNSKLTLPSPSIPSRMPDTPSSRTTRSPIPPV